MDTTSTPSRRDLLRRGSLGAAAAGAVWVAPSVLTLDRAGAGPCGSGACTRTEYSWTASPFSAGTNVTSGSYSVGGTTLTASRSNNNTISNGCPSGTNTTTGVITSQTWGGFSGGVVPMTRIADRNGGIGQAVEMTFNFSTPVRGLSFTVLDIDAQSNGSNEYREEVVVSWVAAAGSPVPTYSPGANLVSTGTNSYAILNNVTNCPCSGTGSGNCNLGVTFDFCGTISSITLRANDLNTALGTSTTAGRAVCVSAMSWCII